MKKFRYSVLVAFAFLVSCRKEIESLSFSTISVDENVRLNDIILLSDSTWIACGGVRDEQGWIFSSYDSGKSWQTFKTDLPKSIYTLATKSGNEIWAGGDFLHLWKSLDGGNTWTFHWLADQVPYHGEDRPAVRRMLWTSDSTGYFVGGENLGEGVIYHTGDGGMNWQFTTQQHEFRALDFLNEGVGIVAGHGAVFTASEGFDSFVQTGFENEFITAVKFINDIQAVAVGNNGGIFKSGDAGKNWSEVFDSNRIFKNRINWNDLTWEENKLVACGNNGMIAVSEDEGESWKLFQLENEPHLFSCTSLNDAFLFTTESGKILETKIP